METNPSRSQAAFRSKHGLLAALAAVLAMGFDKHSNEYRNVARRSVRNGKHSGANPGAFGAPGKAAKAHRELYLRPHAVENPPKA